MLPVGTIIIVVPAILVKDSGGIEAGVRGLLAVTIPITGRTMKIAASTSIAPAPSPTPIVRAVQRVGAIAIKTPPAAAKSI